MCPRIVVVVLTQCMSFVRVQSSALCRTAGSRREAAPPAAPDQASCAPVNWGTRSGRAGGRERGTTGGGAAGGRTGTGDNRRRSLHIL